jgi:hypothetical protein
MTRNLYLPNPEPIPTEKSTTRNLYLPKDPRPGTYTYRKTSDKASKMVKETPPGTYTYRDSEPIPTAKQPNLEPIPTATRNLYLPQNSPTWNLYLPRFYGIRITYRIRGCFHGQRLALVGGLGLRDEVRERREDVNNVLNLTA